MALVPVAIRGDPVLHLLPNNIREDAIDLPPPLRQPYLGRGRVVPSEIRSGRSVNILRRPGSGLWARQRSSHPCRRMSKVEKNIDASRIPMLDIQTFSDPKLPTYAHTKSR